MFLTSAGLTARMDRPIRHPAISGSIFHLGPPLRLPSAPPPLAFIGASKKLRHNAAFDGNPGVSFRSCLFLSSIHPVPALFRSYLKRDGEIFRSEILHLGSRRESGGKTSKLWRRTAISELYIVISRAVESRNFHKERVIPFLSKTSQWRWRKYRNVLPPARMPSRWDRACPHVHPSAATTIQYSVPVLNCTFHVHQGRDFKE